MSAFQVTVDAARAFADFRLDPNATSVGDLTCWAKRLG
jgi:hypothetical protein